MDLPLVSVALLSYNQKDYLREAINSVLLQDYPNIEIVVADDASSDGTQEMLYAYEKKNPGLFKLIFAETNGGITVNSNRAFFACTGTYIARLDGDDLWLPQKIKKQVEVLEKDTKLSASVTAFEVFDNVTGKVIDTEYPSRAVGGKSIFGAKEIAITGNSVSCTSSYVCRRSACPKNGFDDRLQICSDAKFNYDVAKEGPVNIIDEVLVRYRMHSSSSSNTGTGVEPYIFLTMVEYDFPEYNTEFRKLRATYDTWRGLALVQEKQFDQARSLFKSSWCYYPTRHAKVWSLALGMPSFLRKHLVPLLLKKKPRSS